MKLAAIYNAWDCEYMLPKSIECIYAHVDRIIIVWQAVSNFGQLNTLIEPVVKQLALDPKVTLIPYMPNLKSGGTGNETEKRTLGLTEAKKDCSHFLFMDCDEFYVPNEFAQAKEQFIAKGLDTSYCKLITYWQQPNYRLEPLENYVVPFICTTNVKGVGNFPAYCDPTRGVKPAGNCKELDIKMHHMSYVRKDIRQKLENSSARVNIRDMDKRVKEIQEWQFGQPHPFMAGFKIVETESLFEIPI